MAIIKLYFQNFLLKRTGPYGAGNFNTLLLPQFSSHVSRTLWGHWAPMVKYRLLLFLPIGQVLKILALWNFNMDVNGKPKMWNISKTADCRAKRMTIWDSGYYSAHTWGAFDAFVWGHSVHFAKFHNFRNAAPLTVSLDFNQTSYELS